MSFRKATPLPESSFDLAQDKIDPGQAWVTVKMKPKLLSHFTKRESTLVNPSFLLGLFMILAFLGLVDAVYIAYTHYMHIIPPCINGGCEIVLRSKYTELLGVPNAVLGILYYGLVMMLVYFYWSKQTKSVIARNGNDEAISKDRHATLAMTRYIPPLLLILTLLGLIAGIYLLYLQAVVIGAYCQYCLFSELINFLLFDCAWWLWRRSKE